MRLHVRVVRRSFDVMPYQARISRARSTKPAKLQWLHGDFVNDVDSKNVLQLECERNI